MKKSPEKIGDLRREISAALTALRRQAQSLPEQLKPLLHLAPPDGMEADLDLLNQIGRRIRKDAAADYWRRGQGCTVSLSYSAIDPASHPPNPEAENAGESREEPSAGLQGATDALVRALDRAEREPRLHFVSLKWFRDTYLASYGGSQFAGDPDSRRIALVKAIEEQLILTGKTPNPKAPSFPVTSIRLNRRHAEVREILGEACALGTGFDPIEVRGEPLSDTILKERH